MCQHCGTRATCRPEGSSLSVASPAEKGGTYGDDSIAVQENPLQQQELRRRPGGFYSGIGRPDTATLARALAGAQSLAEYEIITLSSGSIPFIGNMWYATTRSGSRPCRGSLPRREATSVPPSLRGLYPQKARLPYRRLLRFLPAALAAFAVGFLVAFAADRAGCAAALKSPRMSSRNLS